MTIVIGGGPAGMMAAYQEKFYGNDVILLEKNEKLGKKLYITGKGRCNLTNNCELEDFFNNVRRNSKFLYSSLHGFTPSDTISFFNNLGLELKTERGNRVFPSSDKSSDVIKCLKNALDDIGVEVHLNEKCLSITKDESFVVVTDLSSYVADKVIIATGGLSYPSTGSTGDGYIFARSFNHTITKLYPSLTGLNLYGDEFESLSGLSLKNVTLKCIVDNREIYSDLGEMLFTHFGVSGPLVLSLSTLICDKKLDNAFISIDFKPALSKEKLNDRLLREFDTYRNKDIANCMTTLLPKSLISFVLSRSGISPNTKCNSITSEERASLISVLKEYRYKIKSTRGFDEAIITRGGVSVDEINPKTMESKLVPGLYFAGEIIDVDAETGGFNIQIALSTGFASGNIFF